VIPPCSGVVTGGAFLSGFGTSSELLLPLQPAKINTLPMESTASTRATGRFILLGPSGLWVIENRDDGARIF
jgi:hypothetical protein